MRIHGYLLGLAGLLPTVLSASFGPAIGPYQIGVTYHVWNHTSVNDTIAPENAKDKLLATIYYPTTQLPTTNNTIPYLDAATAEAYESFFGFPKGDIASLGTPYQENAPFLPTSISTGEKDKLPTVIMSPASNINGIMAAGTIIRFVSAGYTVVVLDHPGEPVFLQLPYGGDLIPGIPLGGDNTTEIVLEIYRLRVSDAVAVVQDLWPSWVDEKNAPFNASHFFMIGQSIGGAAASGAMVETSSIIAGVNIDGSIFQGFDQNGDLNLPIPNLKKPFFFIASEEHELGPEMDPTWWYWAENQTTYWSVFRVNGTTHNNCYDRPEWYDLLGRRDLNSSARIGSIYAPRMDYIVGQYVLGFWDYVLGRGKGLLGGDGAWRFPEVSYVNGSSGAGRPY